jgi:nucleoside-diphosphate-sugar epimerase
MTHVLVTGAGGYIGCLLVEKLLDSGYRVTALDRFFFGIEALSYVQDNPNLTIVRNDTRDIQPEFLRGVDVICDLAALSNDPTGNMIPIVTREVNHQARVRLAGLAKAEGVKRYILSSSCSVYGEAFEGATKETAQTAPISIYAQCNVAAEEGILPLADANFTAVALRNATVFGLSPRMRFDLIVNLMTLHAVEKSRILIMGGGAQWRPLVHVRDVVAAFLLAIEAPAEKVSGQIFNVGAENYQVRSVAYIVRECLPFLVNIEIAPDDPDRRNYNVSFDKIRSTLGFAATRSVADGVAEIYTALKVGVISAPVQTNTAQRYRQILDAKELVDSLTINGRLL